MGQAKSKIKNKNKLRLKFESRDEYFTKNGGLLLEKQIALSQGHDISAAQLRILREHEIRVATNDYDPDLVIGSLRGGTVYKGTFDDRIVAIQTAQVPVPNPKLIDRFLTDVSIGMVVCHDNMVKIYGCCLETCVPMTMYEFYPNEGLYRYLHGDTALEKPLKWKVRLSVAADIAYALSYMHNALSKPVVHRDVRSFGILLDSSFHAKLADFGYCVAITPGKKEQRWPVHGTPGYIDLEYVETQELTEKCDVYSFGVLMLELLTAREPVEMAQCGKDLVEEFVSTTERNGGLEMIDNVLLEEGDMDEVQCFARLAMTCVAIKGDERPNMIRVVEELWRIQDHGHVDSGI